METIDETSKATLVEISAGDRVIIALPRFKRPGETIDNYYTIGSVADFAMKHGDDVTEALERAERLRHATHFMFNEGATITAHATVPEPRIRLELGQDVVFDGIVFTLKPDNNHQIKLAPVA